MSRDTGFSKPQKTLIGARDGGCVIHTGSFDPFTGSCSGPLVAHHRLGRGMGGVKSRNRVANGLLVCSSWNSLVESDAVIAEHARDRGWKLRTDYQVETVPVWVPRLQQFVYLDDQGAYLVQPYGPVIT